MSRPATLLGGVTKHFGSVQALRGVNFDVQRGEVFELLGPNGAGKKTQWFGRPWVSRWRSWC
jgi:ABC-type sugar transport system ATPase subunit